MSYRPKLRTILLLVNTLVLLLPLGSIAIFRLYESELVKQTESELISQAALTASMYRETWVKEVELLKEKGQKVDVALHGNQIDSPATGDGAELSPLPPQLDVATSKIRQPAPPAETPKTFPDTIALTTGNILTPILTDARKVVLSGLRIVDHNGIVVASSSSELGMSLANREEVAKALKGEAASLLRKRYSTSGEASFTSISRRARVRVFVAVPITVENRIIGAVIASRTPLDAPKALFLIRSHLLKASIALVLIVLVMSAVTAYYINRPVSALIRQAKKLEHGAAAGTEPLQNPRIEEVAQLSEAMVRMATAIEDRSTYIKTFATNVSHEFKTPLTSIKGAVELLADHLEEMAPQERERFLLIIGKETERLERLVRRLLDLAKADTASPGEERTEVYPALKALAERYQSLGVELELDCSSMEGAVRMGREAFESVVTNMIENARQHGGENVQISIAGRESQAGASRVWEVVVRDNGPGISAGNRGKIFRPFFTTAREAGGSGVGLAIVQSLLSAHGGSIELEPGDRGASFKVSIPRDNTSV